ncbi:hypothetical protein HGRIS_004912 [Hohenbuehelia grisea]|uniref:RBR-type E3 ubiquitin transferase n=1 Tax=Hohenbuehelia grisea TaxID=104357 RepID=A0ABR3JDT1_9AGAR
MSLDYSDLPRVDGLDDEEMILALQLQMEYEFNLAYTQEESGPYQVEHAYGYPPQAPSPPLEFSPEVSPVAADLSLPPSPGLEPGRHPEPEPEALDIGPSSDQMPPPFNDAIGLATFTNTPPSPALSPSISPNDAVPSTPHFDIATTLSPLSLVHSPTLSASDSPPHPGRKTFTCKVCFDKYDDDDKAEIATCQHIFCRECLRGWITSKINDHRFPIFCPSCTADRDVVEPTIITESVIENIWIPQKQYEIFEEMQLSSMSIRLHCRRCKQSMSVLREDYNREPLITCPLPNCSFSWCSACQKALDDDLFDHSCDTNAVFDGLVRESGWKFCPGCKTPIQKESGCNHMTCASPGCNVNFCYVCGEMIIRSALAREIEAATVAHFREQECQLFEDVPDADVPP